MNQPDYDDHISFLYALTAALREELDITEQQACLNASALLDNMSKRLGGKRVYCPAGGQNTNKTHLRESVQTEWNGRNRAELMQRFGISKATFYRYIGQRCPQDDKY